MPSATASHPTRSPSQPSSSWRSAAAMPVGSIRSKGPWASPSQDRASSYTGPPALKCATVSWVAPSSGGVWRGLDSGSVSCCCFSARTAAYSTRLCEEVCTTEEWENEGRIHASAKRQHLNPSNDGLEFF